MKTRKSDTDLNNVGNEARFYLVFDDVENCGSSDSSEVSFDELDEIDQIRRMILESTEETPAFMTST
jgi:hypothetical protein